MVKENKPMDLASLSRRKQQHRQCNTRVSRIKTFVEILEKNDNFDDDYLRSQLMLASVPFLCSATGLGMLFHFQLKHTVIDTSMASCFEDIERFVSSKVPHGLSFQDHVAFLGAFWDPTSSEGQYNV